MNKSITIISLNFYPEDTAIGLYSTQMAEYLKDSGWDVTVITGFPYYPKWEISDDYKNKTRFIEEEYNGIRILRYKQFTPKDPNFIKRVIHITDFTLGNSFNLGKIKNTDVVFSVIPFTSSAWLGKKLSRKIKAKHWIHIQDFEFDVALESGITSNSILNKYLSKTLSNLESKILNSADIVSTISYGMIDKLKNKSISETFYFPNWIDNDLIDPLKANQHKYLTSRKFKILYSGNIGEKQDWQFFLKIVNHFKTNENIEFIMVGNGSYKSKLIEQTTEYKNVVHYNSVPLSELNDLLCSANLHILFQKNDVIDSVMPSKILGMMASEVPSLITGNKESEIAKIFSSSKTGYFYEPNKIKNILRQIDELISNKKKANAVGKKARKYIVDSFSKEKVLKQFSNKLEEINEI